MSQCAMQVVTAPAARRPRQCCRRGQAPPVRDCDRRRRTRPVRPRRRRHADVARATTGPIAMVSADADPPVDRPNPSEATIWPVKRRTTGSRCGRRSSTPSGASSCCWRSRVSVDRSRQRGRCFSKTARARSSARCSSRPAPIRCGCRSQAPTAPQVFYLRIVRRQPRDRRERATAKHVGGRRRQLHRPRSRRRRSGRAASPSTWSAPEHAPLERVMGAEVGPLRPIRCTKRTASCFISARRSTAIAGRTVTLSGGAHARCRLRRDGRRRQPAIAIAEQVGPERSIAASP